MPIPDRIYLSPPRSRRRRVNWGAVIHQAFRLSGWAATNMLVVLGLFVCAMVLLGNLGFDGMFQQLHNLSARYLEADSVRRGSFQWLVVGLTIVLFFIVGMLRWSALVRRTPPGDNL